MFTIECVHRLLVRLTRSLAGSNSSEIRLSHVRFLSTTCTCIYYIEI